MIGRTTPFLAKIKTGTKHRLMSGLLILIPLGITFLLLRFLFRILSSLLRPIIDSLFDSFPEYLITLISLVALILIIYLTGVVATYVMGRRLLAWGESILTSIPLVNTIYGASKQVVDVFSKSSQQSFRAVVLIEFPGPGMRSIGFVTGRIRDEKDVECYKVFIPTTPNPTSGFLQIIPCNRVVATSLEIEDALKLIMSAGVIAPVQLSTATETAVDENPVD